MAIRQPKEASEVKKEDSPPEAPKTPEATKTHNARKTSKAPRTPEASKTHGSPNTPKASKTQDKATVDEANQDVQIPFLIKQTVDKAAHPYRYLKCEPTVNEALGAEAYAKSA